ncbi:hypothetical protein [Pseudomonas fragariae (ex Marin et al. 2024)]|nr:hypothetical protein [Pseudomonas sp. 20]MDX9625918.1 hypothetical protein [Pseudomonas sp. 20]
MDRWDAGDTSLPAHLAPVSKYIRADMVSVELGDPSDWAAAE